MSKVLLRMSLASLFLVSGALADSFYFSSAGTTVWNGVYVNPYQANDNTQTQNNPLTVYCDDWNTEFSGNPTWNANVYALTPGNVTDFKYGNTVENYNVTLNGTGSSPSDYLSAALGTVPSTFDRYLEAAWLDEQWQDALVSKTGTATMQDQIAAAVWTLFVNSANVGSNLSHPVDGLIGAINNSGYADAVSSYLTDAQTAVSNGYNAAGWYVIVPTGNSFPMQEFLVHGFSGDTVPEPGAVVLLGTVIAILGFMKLRKAHRV